MNVWVAIRSREDMGASKKDACGGIRNEVEEKDNPFLHMDKTAPQLTMWNILNDLSRTHGSITRLTVAK